MTTVSQTIHSLGDFPEYGGARLVFSNVARLGSGMVIWALPTWVPKEYWERFGFLADNDPPSVLLPEGDVVAENVAPCNFVIDSKTQPIYDPTLAFTDKVVVLGYTGYWTVVLDGVLVGSGTIRWINGHPLTPVSASTDVNEDAR